MTCNNYLHGILYTSLASTQYSMDTHTDDDWVYYGSILCVCNLKQISTYSYLFGGIRSRWQSCVRYYKFTITWLVYLPTWEKSRGPHHGQVSQLGRIHGIVCCVRNQQINDSKQGS